MPIQLADVPITFTFVESTGNNGAIANGLTLTITDGTFAGDNGDALGAVTGIAEGNGLTPVLVKTSATTAKLTFKGTAKNHASANDISNLKVTFSKPDFAIGRDTVPEAGLSTRDIVIDFKDESATGALSLVPPEGAGTSAIYNENNLPTLTGKVPTGATAVYIYNNGGTKPFGTATVSGDTWSFAVPKTGLKDGDYVLTASTTNDGKGAMSAAFAFTVDQKDPAAPSVNVIKGATSDTTPVLTGKAEKGAKVEVFADGDTQAKSLGVTFADDKGVWTLPVDGANTELVTDNTYKISAKATDAAGNATKSKKPVDLIIDTKIAQPEITTTLTASLNKSAQTLQGKVTGETNGGTVQLYGGEDGSLLLGKPVKLDKNGVWKASVKLTEGKHLLSVVAIDTAGNVSDNSAVQTVVVDTGTVNPKITKVGETKGASNVLPTVVGTAEAGATVEVFSGSVSLGKVTADAYGQWVLDGQTKTVKDGVQKITAKATDTAKNVSKVSAPDSTYSTAKDFKDATAPTLLLAETSADGAEVVLVYSQALAATGPVKGNFVVTVGTTTPRTPSISDVQVAGSKVTLKLTAAVAAGETVKVAYTAPTVDTAATNAAIQDTTGNDAATLTDQEVTNKVSAEDGGTVVDPTAPVLNAVGYRGNRVVLDFDKALDETVTLDKAELIVTLSDSSTAEVSAAAFSEGNLFLNLASPVPLDKYIQAIEYNGTFLQDSAGYQVQPINLQDSTGKISGWIEGTINAETLNGGGGDDYIVGDAGDDTIAGGAGNNSLDGGDGDDLFSFAVDGNGDQLAQAITVIGGLGSDTIRAWNGGGSISLGDESFAKMTGVEVLSLASSGASNQVVLGTNASAAFSSGVRVVTEVEDMLYLDASAMTVSINATGGNGNDKIKGGAVNDTITGGAGADNLTGGLGADDLTGGLGADTFVIGAVADAGDTIQDFNVGEGDKLVVSAVSEGKFYQTGVTLGSDFQTKSIFIFTGQPVSIADAAQAIAADPSVNNVGNLDGSRGGIIVITNAAGNAEVWHTTSAANNGTETLLVTLVGVTSAGLNESNLIG